MSKVQILRSLVNQRLSAAAEEIFELFERTIAEYEEEILRSREKEKLQDRDFNPEVQLLRTDLSSDAHQLMVKEEEVLPEQQERSPSLKQENPAGAADIKEEQEEVWSSQDREQFQEPEEDDISTFMFSSVPVKSGDNEERLDENQTEDFYPHSHLQPYKTSHQSGFGTDDGELEDSDEPQEGLNLLQTKDGAIRDITCNTGDALFSFSDCSPSFGQKRQLKKHKGVQKQMKTFSCQICGKRFTQSGSLNRHSLVHTGEKPFMCGVCGKSFTTRADLKKHSVVHTGVKPFGCSICGKRFTQSGSLKIHLKAHTGEKPYSCSVCGKGFKLSGALKSHSKVHIEEKPFSCSVCGKGFVTQGNLRQHAVIHSGEKPFSCSICDKSFFQLVNLRQHFISHTEEKPFSCSFCDKKFSCIVYVKRHMRGCKGSRNAETTFGI